VRHPGPVTERDLKRLGSAVVAIRTRLGLTQDEFANQATLSIKTVQRIEGARGTPRAVTLNLIDRIAPKAYPNWQPGDARKIMDGHLPSPSAPDPTDAVASAARQRIIEMTDEEIAERIAEAVELQGPAAAGELLRRIWDIRAGIQQHS
jgi:transcriptional regulator with XRE-family HTH domain